MLELPLEGHHWVPILTHNWFQVYPIQDLTSYQDSLVSSDKIWNQHRATTEAIHSKYLLSFGLLIYFTFFPAWGTAWRKTQHLYQPHLFSNKLAKVKGQLKFQTGESDVLWGVNMQPFHFLFFSLLLPSRETRNKMRYIQLTSPCPYFQQFT